MSNTPSVPLKDLFEGTKFTRCLEYSFRVYKKIQTRRLYTRLHLYVIAPYGYGKARGAYPAIVFIHGGGWGAGAPGYWYPPSRYFAARGIVAICVQYRLRSKKSGNTISTCIEDCKSAMRYIRKNAISLKVDPEKICVVGESAGGHLAAAVGTVKGFDATGEDLTINTRPNILVLLNPITDMVGTRWGRGVGRDREKISPLHNIDKKTPPTLLIHGDKDSCVGIGHSLSFHKTLQKTGVETKLITLKGVNHAFAVFYYGPKKQSAVTYVLIDRWLVAHGYLKGRPLLMVPK